MSKREKRIIYFHAFDRELKIKIEDGGSTGKNIVKPLTKDSGGFIKYDPFKDDYETIAKLFGAYHMEVPSLTPFVDNPDLLNKYVEENLPPELWL